MSISTFKVRKGSFEKSMKIKPHHIMKDSGLICYKRPNSENGRECH